MYFPRKGVACLLTTKIEALADNYHEFVSQEAVRQEWMVLYHVMRSSAYKHLDSNGCHEHLLHPNRETYSNISKLSAIGLTLPVTSVNCERGISAYNAIKTDARNMLSVTHMGNMLTMYLESPGLDNFDFERSFELWVKAKERRGYSSMVKDVR